ETENTQRLPRHTLLCSILYRVHHHDVHSFPTRRSSDLQQQVPRLAQRTRSLDGIDQLQVRQPSNPPAARFVRAQVFTTVPLGRRSEEHTSELQSRENLVCRLLLEKNKARRRMDQAVQNG